MPNFLKLIERGRTEEIRAILDSCPRNSLSAHVNCKDPAGFTPMHYAAVGGHVEIIRILHAKGADLNAKATSDEISPLHVAVGANLDFVVYELINLGADKDIKDKYGLSALDLGLKVPSMNLPFKAIVELIKSGVAITNLSSYLNALIIGAAQNEVDAMRELKDLSCEEGRGVIFPHMQNPLLNVNTLALHAILGLAPEMLEYIWNEENTDSHFRAAEGFGSALIVATEQDTLFHHLVQMLPTLNMLQAPYKLYSSSRNNPSLEANELREIIGVIGANIRARFNGTKYSIDQVSLGVLSFEFDEVGRFTNKDELLVRLRRIIELLQAHGCEINQTYNGKSAVGTILIDRPVEILEIFYEYGARFNINDLHYAMLNADATAVKFLLEKEVNVLGFGYTDQTTEQILSECENEQLLNFRPELMRVIAELTVKQQEELAAQERINAARREAVAHEHSLVALDGASVATNVAIPMAEDSLGVNIRSTSDVHEPAGI
ncbi:MAG: hypothetical protein HOI53_01010 [Francisellaceae bacterium]|jgi:hypothetical protein|nr:hypothetical protein [Francisellaceae bacterium]MBT6206580.1 hypothetical protein [Francisellaceae bacterium]MBT6538631.1 hypothetical protein [Francisellaceae bacterium]